MNRAHAVVIGSGFGGLAAAVRLGARGYRVTVLERLDAPGGRAYVFHQDGFTFDAGPTIVTAPALFESLWSLCGRRLADDVTLKPLSPFYRICFADGSALNWSGDAAAMEVEIARLAPDDLAGYRRFMRVSEKLYRIAFERLMHLPFSRWQDMARQLPNLLRLRAYRSLYAVVASHVRDPRLRFALSFHPLFVGGNPFRTSALYGLIVHLERLGGVHYVMGGTGKLVQGLVRLIESQGGEVRCNSEVRRITLRDRMARGVELASGERLAADVVVSNADAAWTYRELLAGERHQHWNESRWRRAQYSMSLFIWYFGTRRQYPEVGHHTILVGPRYRKLITEIFAGRQLAPDFSLYLHRPTASDPSVAPAGCDAFYVLAPVPHLRSGIDWRREAEPYRRRIEAHLSDSLLPGLKENIVTSRMMTPEDFQDRLLSVHGAAFGLQPLLRQSAWFRPHNQSEDFAHLYLVGAGTHPGAGLPGVVSSARVLDTVVPHGSTFV
jgi:phytoene desaturase